VSSGEIVKLSGVAMRPVLRTVPWVVASALLPGCHQLALKGLDQAQLYGAESHAAPDIQVPDGFRAVRIVQGLDYPSSLTFDGAGRLYILESHTVPVPLTKRRILKVVGQHLEEVELKGGAAPTGEIAVGLTFHEGWLYFSHEEKDGTFGISRVRPQGGAVEAVLRGLTAQGDHDVNYLVFDRKGTLYFGLGSVTNSGVVSSHDPVNAKWLKVHPGAREIPCRDIVLTGQSFTEKNALTPQSDDTATTGAFQAYGRSGAKRIPGEPLCSGSLYELPRGAAKPVLVAWGFRNPVALAVDGQDQVYVGMHGADVRGTRPVLDDPDAVYRVRRGAWYGWPDYSAELLPFTDPRYQPPAKFLAEGHDRIGFLIDHAASGLQPPDRSLLVTATVPHAALGGMTFVPPGGPFGRWAGQLLISEMGDFKPTTDAVHPDTRAGFQVEAVDMATGTRTVFARNRGQGPAVPASRLDLQEAFERPVDVKVGPDGLVYVLDFGVFESTEKAAKVMPKTGKVFRIEPVPGRRASAP
jgi:glucose/arabinose dehydrogenase